MNFDNEFKVSLPIGQAWEVLTDLKGIAPCMPGAKLTGSDGDTYSGTVKVKVGPVTTEYAGTATLVEKDGAAYRAVISAKGREARGAGNASATITARLRPDGDETVVSVGTDLKISGKIAQFGSSVIAEVSEKLLGQFVDSLEAMLASKSEGGATAPEAGSPDEHSEQAEHVEDAAPAATQDGSARPLRAVEPSPEPEAIDLMKLARGSVAKRLVPAAIVAAVVALVIYLIVRHDPGNDP
jgi:hypothetical protein